MRADKAEEILRRLKCVEGHVRGVARLAEKDADCLAILLQVKALRGALDKISLLILQEHLQHCLPMELGSDDSDKWQRALMPISELVAAARS